MRNKQEAVREMLEFIICPITKEKLVYDEKANLLISSAAAFPVVDGIPVLLVDRAMPLSGGDSQQTD